MAESTKSGNTYMYGPASMDRETRRLIRLNKLHNPRTMPLSDATLTIDPD